MANQVLLFTLNGCGHCKTLKERLNKESLPFTEVEVGKNQELWNKIVEQTVFFNGVPTNTFIAYTCESLSNSSTGVKDTLEKILGK